MKEETAEAIKRGYIKAGAAFLRSHDGITCIATSDILCDVQPGQGGRMTVEYSEPDLWAGTRTTRRATVYSRDLKYA